MTNRLIHGDCMIVLRGLEGVADAVITDPPYGIDYQSSRRIDKTKRLPKIANDKSPFVWWLPAAYRAIKDVGCLVCFCRWDVQEAFRQAIEWAGFTVKSQLVWDRQIHGMGDLKGTPAPQHDVAWFAVKGAYKLPGKRPKSVFSVRRLSGDQLVHPTEKPVELMRQMVDSFVPPGGVVIDPFAGSGSTLLGASVSGRHWIGIEMDDGHYQTASLRLEAK